MSFSQEEGLPNDWLLQQEPFEGLIGKILGQKFEWLNFAPRIKLDGAESVAWAKELYSPDNDPEKRFPRRISAGADWVRVKASKVTEAQATLAAWGFEFVITERARRYKKNIDVLARLLKRQANWLGEWQNARIIGTLMDANEGVQTVPQTGSFYTRSVTKWGSNGYNPIADMILLKDDFEDAQTGYSATRFVVSKTKFRQALTYLMNMDVRKEDRESMWGMAKAGLDQIYIPVLNATLQMAKYGLADGDILVLDDSLSPFTIYYDHNPEYGPAPSFELENGQTLPNDFGLHSFGYKTNDKHEYIKQVWLENVIATKDASAGMKCFNGAQGI